MGCPRFLSQQLGGWCLWDVLQHKFSNPEEHAQHTATLPSCLDVSLPQGLLQSFGLGQLLY